MDLTNGVMKAVPTPGGQAPVIDGDLSDWDLSAQEPIWIAPETAERLHADVALEYDADALYVSAKVSLPGRGLHNPNNPVDAFWGGDILEFRLASDPALPAPLTPRDAAVKASDRVVHLSLWKNSQTNADYLNVSYGVAFDKGSAANPAGTRVVIKQHGTEYYVVEARIPWSALHVPGGHNPFGPGQRMTAVWQVHWGGDTQTAGLYRTNPGTFAFSQAETWGQVEFSPTGGLPPVHVTMREALAALVPRPVGVPITLDVPAPGKSGTLKKVSVNILGPRGEVIRELMGGEGHSPGPLSVFWDGHDQWGAPVPPGVYRWGAYFSDGLEAQFMGAAGTSGHPAYETADGRGGWGGDHGACVGTAADATGLYFLWVAAEDGRAVVKTDYAGRVLWRKTPFVGGGFGPHWAVAAGGKYVFVNYNDNNPELLRLDAATGQILPFGGAATVPISHSKMAAVPKQSSPFGSQPETAGLAASASEVFASVYSQNVIRVLDPETGAPVRELACPGPRGLARDFSGNLFAVSYVPGRMAQVLEFPNGRGAGQPVVTRGLLAPWGLAVDAAGRIHVSDEGASQQVKTFSPAGALIAVLGKAGGRPWAGAYDPASFLQPAGLAADAQGGILVAEASPPKVMSRLDAATGKVLGRWFGQRAYSSVAWADPVDPWTVYYTLEGPTSIARARIPSPGANGVPQAYWSLPQAGFTGVDTLVDAVGAPFVTLADNGRKYLVSDSGLHTVCLIQGDQLLPVGHARVADGRKEKPGLELWSDADGDHKPQPGEMTQITSVAGSPLAGINNSTGSLWMAASGDLYLMTNDGRILKVPAAGFATNGAIRWDTARASYVVPAALDAAHVDGSLGSGWRSGLLGARADAQGNVYACFNTNAKYATPALTRAMQEGLGHTGEHNAVKFAKYAPDGHLLWMTGRKATAAAKPGEVYHTWIMAGLVGPPGNEYLAAQSEWGTIAFYTHDGFFVDTLMDNPGLAPPASPYTFGSETFGCRVQYFPKLDQTWAYQTGMAYRVAGFTHGAVAGEARRYGQVVLDRAYDADVTAAAPTAPLHVTPLSGAPLTDPSVWGGLPVSTLRRNGADLATAQIGYDAQFLYVRLHVSDPTPLENSADTPSLAFKGGDTAGIVLGPAGQRDRAALGDVRLMAAQINGQPRLLAMKAVSGQAKHAEDYYTPASGHVTFDYVGDVPGGRVTLEKDPDGQGYVAAFAVPRSFLEFPLAPGASLSGDVEVRLSGQGARGPQTTSRNYLFTPLRGETTMTDDIPTEARLYPQYWGSVEVK